MRIDFHVHIGSWKAPFLFGLSSNIKDLLKIMAQENIDGAVVMPSDSQENKELLTKIQKVKEKKLWFFPWIRPKDTSMIKFLESYSKDIKGLKIHPSFEKLPITDQRYKKFLDFAKINKIPILVHCGRWKEVAGFKFALEVALKYPEVNFVLAHQGGNDPLLREEACTWVNKRNIHNVYFDITGLGIYWMIQRGIELLGAERFVFGSDYPLSHPKIHLAQVRCLDLTFKEEQAILGQNAARLLGI
jgi:hypothetical protein